MRLYQGNAKDLVGKQIDNVYTDVIIITWRELT